MAEYLDQKKQCIIIIGIGTSWYEFRTVRRAGWHGDDFSFLGSHLTKEQIKLLNKAAVYAGKKTQPPKSPGWFDNKHRPPPPDVHNMITKEAIAENSIFVQGTENFLEGFDNKCLRVLCPPAKYVICVELEKLYNTYYRVNRVCPVDKKKAFGQLLVDFMRPGGPFSTAAVWKVSYQDILRWVKLYKFPVDDAVLGDVIRACRRDGTLLMTDACTSGNILIPLGATPQNLIPHQPAIGLVSYEELNRTVVWLGQERPIQRSQAEHRPVRFELQYTCTNSGRSRPEFVRLDDSGLIGVDHHA